MKPAYSKLFLMVILCFFGILVYSNSFNSPFHFDGTHQIVDNPDIRELSDLGTISKHPSRFITYFTLALNYHFHQLNVFGYHVLNLIIHLGSAMMVFWLTLITLSTSPLKDNKIARHSNLIAFFAALIFVVHPVQIQAVTYIIQRATSLVSFFYISSLCFYAKFRLSQINNSSFRNRLLYLLGFLMAAILGMLTKELIVTLPLMIILYEVCFLRIKDYFKLKYFVVLAILLAIIYFTILFPRFKSFSSLEEALGARVTVTPVQYILTQFRVLVTYIRLFFIPVNQTLLYEYPVIKTISEPSVLGSIFFIFLILFFAFKLYPKYRLVSFGVFWFFFALSQEFTIMPVYFFFMQYSREIIYEERLYLPMVGCSIFLVSAIYYTVGHKNIKRMIIILLIMATSYAILTYNRNLVWKDEFTLWDDTVRKSPGKARPYNNRGLINAQRGKHEEAIADFNKALELNPNYFHIYYNRGLAYHESGNLDRAISDYNMSLKTSPGFWRAHFNRGNLYQRKGNLDYAISDYNKTIEANPGHAAVYYNRAVAYFGKGEYNKAWEDLHKAETLGLKPGEDFLELLKRALGRER